MRFHSNMFAYLLELSWCDQICCVLNTVDLTFCRPLRFAQTVCRVCGESRVPFIVVLQIASAKSRAAPSRRSHSNLILEFSHLTRQNSCSVQYDTNNWRWPPTKKTKPGFGLRLGFSLSVSAPARCGRLWGSAQTDGVQSLVRDPLVLVRGARVKRGCLGLAYQPQTDRKIRKYKNYQELVICEDHHLHLQHMQPPCLPSLLSVNTKVIRIRMCWTCYLPHVWGYLFTYT